MTETATQQTMFFSTTFLEYHEKHPEVYKEFERLAFETIKKGFKHYGSKGIFELLRWQKASDMRKEDKNESFKINNNFTPLYARLFEEKNPAHKGFFRMKKSKFD